MTTQTTKEQHKVCFASNRIVNHMENIKAIKRAKMIMKKIEASPRDHQ